MALRNTKQGEKRKMENLSSGLTGIKHPVEWIELGDDLGYTEKNGTIHVAYQNQTFMSDLDVPSSIAFRLGVFGHELLHQIFTDFDALEEIINKHPDNEKQLLSTLINLIEDPAIEYHAPLVYGGELLSCLRFSIKQIYRCSPEIDTEDDPLVQVLNALVYFGDIGVIKGSFTSNEAYEYFSKIVPSFYETIHEGNSRKRMEKAEEWLELLRPLWEKEEEKNKKQQNALSNFQKQNGISSPSGSGGQQVNPGSSNDESGDGGEQSNSDGGSGSRGDSESHQKDILKRLLDSMKDDSEGSMKSFNDFEKQESENSKVNSKSFRDEELPDELKDELKKQIDQLENVVRKELIEKSKESSYFNQDSNSFLPGRNKFRYQFGHDDGSSINAKNERMTDKQVNESEYFKLIDMCNRQISMLANSMKTLFNNDNDTMLRRTSGKYNIKRGAYGNTANIFDKRRHKSDIDDIAVMLMVDESGSMYGAKNEAAKTCALILAEAFAKLKIPCYIIGFSVREGYDAVHHHYVTWTNTVKERQSLSLVSANGSNYDSYSISFGEHILKQKNAAHKILFVISDGAPACRRYKNFEDGLEQTRLSIKNARKTASVIGVGIQCEEEDEMRKMYNGSFVNLKDASMLTTEVIKLLKKVVTSY